MLSVREIKHNSLWLMINPMQQSPKNSFLPSLIFVHNWYKVCWLCVHFNLYVFQVPFKSFYTSNIEPDSSILETDITYMLKEF